MCGRYVIEDFQELSETLRQIPFQTDYDPEPTWNAAPSQTLPVIVVEDGPWHLRPVKCGLIPRWVKSGERPTVAPLNARSARLAERRMFRSLLMASGCRV